MRLGRAALALTVMALVGSVGYPASSVSAAQLPTAKATASSAASPPCSTASASGPLLGHVKSATLSTPGSPFGVVVAPGNQWAFVSLAYSVEVLRLGAALRPTPVRTIPVTDAVGDGPVGETMTRDGKYLLVALGNGAAVIDAARAESGAPHPVLGRLIAPNADDSAIEVTLSRYDKFAFITEEYSDQAVVFNFHRAITYGFRPADYVGAIPLGQAAVGMALSPDGRWLYATSELAATAPPTGPGTLTLINVHRAESNPAKSVVAVVHAGCQPVRVIASPDGQHVWVTARASDDLLCFSTKLLRTKPASALISTVRVGVEPVGLALIKNDSLIVVADSDRFGVPGAVANIEVVDVAAALRGDTTHALLGYVPSGLFPREMAATSTKLLLTNYLSDQLQTVSIATLPRG